MKRGNVIILCIILLLSLAFVNSESDNQKQGIISEKSEFCGTSTNGFCETDEDCITSGCSGEICQNKKNQDIASICVWQDCYDNEKYNMNCICSNNQCKWMQKTIQKAITIKNRLRIAAANASECPNDCSCDGSSIKCRLQNGTREMTITAGKSGNTIVQVKNSNASTQVQLFKSDEGKVYAVFKNNETREIILPDEVQERIEAKLRERVRLNNTNITLNEDGQYEVQARKRARLLWIIPVQERVQAQVDAETGEIIRQRSSWWGFLASDVKSE